MINANYMDHITVESVANALRLDRRYLSRIFKERIGMSLKDYITKVRMERAMEHLSSGKSVALTAELVGYVDVFNFSKMFKKHTGVSPRKYMYQRDELAEAVGPFADCESSQSDTIRCPYLGRAIDQGVCYDMQMIANNVIKPKALPDIDIDKEKLLTLCRSCDGKM